MVSNKGRRHGRHHSDWQQADDEFYREAYPSSSGNPIPSAGGDHAPNPYSALPSKTLRKGEGHYAEIAELDDKIARIRRFARPMRDKRRCLRDAKDEPSPRSEIVGSVAAHRQRTCNKARIYWRNHRKLFIPFSSSLKSIQGRFGTGLGSYFIFLRWLLGLNFAMSLMLFGFVVVPAVLSRRPPSPDMESCSANGPGSVECCSARYATATCCRDDNDVVSTLSGSGWLEMTYLFYGFYSGSRMSFEVSEVVYHFPLAYMLTCAGCFLLSFLLIVYESAKRFRENLVSDKGNFHAYCNVVFASWDFCIKDPKSAGVEHNVIANELKMMLQAERLVEQRKGMSRNARWRLFFKRLLGHLVAMGIFVASGIAIYVAVVRSSPESRLSDELRERNRTGTYAESPSEARSLNLDAGWMVPYVPSFTITALNILVPTVFVILGQMEEYSPDRQVRLQVLRTIGLRFASIVVMMASFHGQICTPGPENCCDSLLCWETYVGRELYKLTIFDMLGTLVVVFVFGPLRKALAQLLSGRPGLQRIVRVEFDLPRQVVDLVYSQSLSWFSLIFSPLTPMLTVVKFFLFFHVKYFHLKFVCAPSLLLYRASRANALFMGALLVSFLFVSLPLGLMVLEVHPSKACGPFRGEKFMWSVVIKSIDEWPVWVKSVLGFVSTAGFVVPALIVLVLFLYYYWALAAAHRSMVSRLQEQLILENRDKQFLLARLNAMLNSQKSSTGRSSGSEATPLRSN